MGISQSPPPLLRAVQELATRLWLEASGANRLRTPEAALLLTLGPYRARLAISEQDRHAAYSLRFRVFNLEMQEGLERAYHTGEDSDQFDSVCDHLLVEHAATRQVVGTYRLQAGTTAARNHGYYSAREFDFRPYEPLRGQVLELGRACVQREHRSFEVLMLLWRGIARYAEGRGLRYLLGCSSLTSQDPREGSAMYHRLRPYLVEAELLTMPTASYAFPVDDSAVSCAQPPKLLRSYLAVGAQICGPPALDREFGTIDFLTFMDLERLSPAAKARFLR